MTEEIPDCRSPSVYILSLMRHSNVLEFHELQKFPGLSNIRLLSGDVIGCAVVNDISIPHIINWKTSDMHALGKLRNS